MDTFGWMGKWTRALCVEITKKSHTNSYFSIGLFSTILKIEAPRLSLNLNTIYILGIYIFILHETSLYIALSKFDPNNQLQQTAVLWVLRVVRLDLADDSGTNWSIYNSAVSNLHVTHATSSFEFRISCCWGLACCCAALPRINEKINTQQALSLMSFEFQTT